VSISDGQIQVASEIIEASEWFSSSSERIMPMGTHIPNPDDRSYGRATYPLWDDPDGRVVYMDIQQKVKILRFE